MFETLPDCEMKGYRNFVKGQGSRNIKYGPVLCQFLKFNDGFPFLAKDSWVHVFYRYDIFSRFIAILVCRNKCLKSSPVTENAVFCGFSCKTL